MTTDQDYERLIRSFEHATGGSDDDLLIGAIGTIIGEVEVALTRRIEGLEREIERLKEELGR